MKTVKTKYFIDSFKKPAALVHAINLYFFFLLAFTRHAFIHLKVTSLSTATQIIYIFNSESVTMLCMCRCVCFFLFILAQLIFILCIPNVCTCDEFGQSLWNPLRAATLLCTLLVFIFMHVNVSCEMKSGCYVMLSYSYKC